MKIAIVLFLAILFFVLVKQKLLQIDLSFPWFLGLMILGFLGTNEAAIYWMASIFDIAYAPLIIILFALFFLLGLTTLLAVAYSRLRERQIKIVRQLAQFELDTQENRRNAAMIRSL